MRKISYGGVTCSEGTKAKSFKRHFDAIRDWDSDEEIYISKKTYTHEEDGLNFDYNYIVKFMNMYELTGDDDQKGKFGVELCMLPTKKFLSKEYIEDVMSACGLESADEVRADDIIDTVTVPTLQYDTIENIRSWEGKKLTNVKNDIATVIDTIDNLRGFWMDKSVNMIGTTNWDLLHTCLNGGNPYERALKGL